MPSVALNYDWQHKRQDKQHLNCKVSFTETDGYSFLIICSFYKTDMQIKYREEIKKMELNIGNMGCGKQYLTNPNIIILGHLCRIMCLQY